MAQVYNADLANSCGNLCSRAFNMTNKSFAGNVPAVLNSPPVEGCPDGAGGAAGARAVLKSPPVEGGPEGAGWSAGGNNPLATLAASIYPRYTAAMEAVDYSAAMAAVMELVNRANLYVEESAPWALAKAGEQEQLANVMYNILESIRIAAVLFAPVMPNSSAEVYKRLGLGDVSTTKDLGSSAAWGLLPADNNVEIGEPLFPRLKAEDL
jgi:methionyl-tRNA synthetase